MVPDEPSSTLIGRLETRVSDALRSRLQSEPHAGQRLNIIGEALRPPEAQLLDTSVLQNLDWVDRELEAAEAG